MEVTFKGIIKIVTANSFQIKETGENIEYFTNFIAFQDLEGKTKVGEINSKENYTEEIGKELQITLRLLRERSNPKFYRVQILTLNPDIR